MGAVLEFVRSPAGVVTGLLVICWMVAFAWETRYVKE